ncbi:hypothetical protein KW796_03090 [Candidatus Parcubacteria bacterium]|nr:hypothetical protein [Candidatus Parcubacteria bacterium]
MSSEPREKHSHKHVDNLKVEKLPDSRAVVTGELTLEILSESRQSALKAINGRIKVPGFRAGNIPENVLVKQLGEMRILEEVAEVALAHAYGEIMREAKLSPIGRPEVSITKLAPGIPLEFKIAVTLEPEFILPDYKKIARESVKTEETLIITDAEIDAVLAEIMKQGWKPPTKEGEDIRETVKKNLMEEKKYRAKEKRRITIIEALVKAAEIKIPQLLIDAELDKMVAQFKDDVVRHGMKWDEYLSSIKKTESDIRAEWKEKAENRAKSELIIDKIAGAEKLEPKTEELEHEAKHLLSHHPDADPLRVRMYVYQMLRTQKVLEFLET